MDVQTIIDTAGGVIQLAEKLGVSRTTILGWKKEKFIPANRVAQISQGLCLPLEEVVKLAPKPAPRASEVAAA